MDFYIILQQIMDEKQLSIPEVARLCNLSDSTVRSILKRKQKHVALESAFKLAHGLNVSLERLNGTESPRPASDDLPHLSANEQELLEKYNALSPANRAKLEELLDLYLGGQGKT